MPPKPSLAKMCARLVGKLGASGSTFKEQVDSALDLLGVEDKAVRDSNLVDKAVFALTHAGLWAGLLKDERATAPATEFRQSGEGGGDDEAAAANELQRRVDGGDDDEDGELVLAIEDEPVQALGDDQPMPASEKDSGEGARGAESSGLDDARVPQEWIDLTNSLRAQRRVDKKLGEDEEDDEPFRVVFVKGGGQTAKNMQNGHPDVCIQCLVPGCMNSRNRVKHKGISKSGGGSSKGPSFSNFLSHLASSGHKANLDAERKRRMRKRKVDDAVGQGETGEDEPRLRRRLPQPHVASPEKETAPWLSDDPDERAEALKAEFGADFVFDVKKKSKGDGGGGDDDEDCDDDSDVGDGGGFVDDGSEVRCRFCRKERGPLSFPLAAPNIRQQLERHRSSSDHQTTRPLDGQTTIFGSLAYKKERPTRH